MLIFRCTKNDPRVCEAENILSSTFSSHPCISQGKISITSPLGPSFVYRISNSPYQASPDFVSLLPGNHKITVKDERGCTCTTDIIVPEITSGSLFAIVKNILKTNCISCHSGSNPQAGIDFSRSCDIITYWDRIKARAVDGNPAPMPQAGLLPLSERNKITDWITAGHRFTD